MAAAGYSGSPLSKKLGIKKGFNIFNEKEIAEDNRELSLAPWDYKVYNVD